MIIIIIRRRRRRRREEEEFEKKKKMMMKKKKMMMEEEEEGKKEKKKKKLKKKKLTTSYAVYFVRDYIINVNVVKICDNLYISPSHTLDSVTTFIYLFIYVFICLFIKEPVWSRSIEDVIYLCLFNLAKGRHCFV